MPHTHTIVKEGSSLPNIQTKRIRLDNTASPPDTLGDSRGGNLKITIDILHRKLQPISGPSAEISAEERFLAKFVKIGVLCTSDPDHLEELGSLHDNEKLIEGMKSIGIINENDEFRNCSIDKTVFKCFDYVETLFSF